MIDFLLLCLFGLFKGTIFFSAFVADLPGKKEPYWCTYVRRRIIQHKNFIVVITGPTGSGKTLAGISIAKMLDPTFDETRIIFGLRGLMKLLLSGEKFPPNTVFLWDEFQIGGSSRSWQSLANQLLIQLLSTFRHRRFILIITCPYTDFIDSSSRKLLHAEFSTVSIDFAKQLTKIKPQLIQYNGRTKKFYYKYLRVATKTGMAPVKSWNIARPPKDLEEKYEAKKNAFTRDLNLDIQKQLDLLDKNSGVKETRPELTEIQENVLKLKAVLKDNNEVAKELGVAPRTVRFHITQAKKKGYAPKHYENTQEEDI